MHFTYEKVGYSSTELMQGDVLKKTPELNDVLRTVHPHFFQHPKNLFFMVLTQSCDLIRRGPQLKCKAPYIAIAPVRSLEFVIEKQVSQLSSANVKAALPVVGNKSKNKLNELLGRLLNNNEPGFFIWTQMGHLSAATALPYLTCRSRSNPTFISRSVRRQRSFSSRTLSRQSSDGSSGSCIRASAHKTWTLI
jgi:hypothetical protein